MLNILKKGIGLVVCAITSVCVLTSCNKNTEPVHENQLEELENFEYKDYFSSLCEFGYNTETKKDSECFTATQDNYVTDLMSETGASYTTKGILNSDTYGISFRLHFKGGCRLKSIEFDFKALNGYKYVISFAHNYSSLSKEQNYDDVKGVAMNNHRYNTFKWEKESHFVFNFDNENNFKSKNELTDSINIKFCQTTSKTSFNYGVAISNLKINLYADNSIN